MDFYTALSQYYDEIFAVSQDDMAFINSLIPPRGRVLDVGCGTGNKTVLLGNAADITGIDLDAGMIDRARVQHARPHIQYRQMDMRRLTEHFAPVSAAAAVNAVPAAASAPAPALGERPLDTVLCLGNTLVHLPEDELAPFLRSVRALLREGGSVVIQILNYDRILDRGVDTLPVIKTAHATFTRQYRWVDGQMHFVTAITLRDGGARMENDIILYPLRVAALERLLLASGFRSVRWYGSFSGGPLTGDSFVAMAHALA